MTTAFTIATPTPINSITGGGSCRELRVGKSKYCETRQLRPKCARRRRSTIILCDEISRDGGGGREKDEEELVLPDLRALFDTSGDPNCEQCGGKGEVLCVLCGGKGFISLTMMDTVSSSQCRLCKGKKVIPCPSCRELVYKSVLWWDLIPSKEDDPEEKWREGPDGEPRIRWTDNPANPSS